MSKNLLLFSKESRGGLETFFRQLLLLQEKGYKFKFYFYKKDKLTNYEGFDKEFINIKYPKGLGFTVRKIVVFFDNVLATHRLIRASKAKIFFCADIYSYAVVSFVKILFRDPTHRFLFLVNNNYKYIVKYRREKLFGAFLTLLFKALVRFPDKFIFTSQKLARDSSDFFHIDPKKTTVIAHSSDIKKIKKLADEKINSKEEKLLTQRKIVKIFYIGRIDVFQKDILTIIKAYSHLLKRGAKAKLFLVGDGYERNKIVRKVKRLGMEEKVSFMGWKKNIYKYLKHADVFWFSSFFEGFGMTIVEALASGVPVVATDSPYGPSEILANGKYGVLVPVGDYKKFASATLELMNNSKLRKHFSKEGRIRAEKYDCKKMLRQYEKLLSSI